MKSTVLHEKSLDCYRDMQRPVTSHHAESELALKLYSGHFTLTWHKTLARSMACALACLSLVGFQRDLKSAYLSCYILLLVALRVHSYTCTMSVLRFELAFTAMYCPWSDSATTREQRSRESYCYRCPITVESSMCSAVDSENKSSSVRNDVVE